MPSFSTNPRKRPVFKIAAIDDQEKFRPLPPPVGSYPYHLVLEELKPNLPENKMVFHICGDTGGITLPTFQHQVVSEMMKQYDETIVEQDKPQFFFHLGDLVYNFGQEHKYYPQFFEPFKNYPAPIFAISGNHDADVDANDPLKPKSLDAFLKVFCDTQSRPIPFAGDTNFKSNIQPNIYWTLETPLANIICLYSNVPRFGTITPEQKDWFVEELKKAGNQKNEKAIVICLHHSAYSADTNHGSSLRMQLFLNECFEDANVIPNIVLSGHVHNYQRFSKHYPDGKVLPFVVAGAGGYAQLHAIAPLNDAEFPDTSNYLDNVFLEKYCDNKHGFLKIAIEKTADQFNLSGNYYTIPTEGTLNEQASLLDSFTINLK
ncbi:calcineurin-like phosphoesterase family protein [Mucilaginibacter frigoritolerans]|uniref:Calcineurin-like phosphoesterase family protein n=1 Tax=Mucilaginibacter frigoritolerans TaxID=652788 RepID=A0A562U4Q2_9SPHI|nr:metallophosphoesterase [Mucilaginibacter frigoritolerans]TWJ00748.1 calcineurin-like phosphoesterase family protein [Mucilaginibacter frigoritolerans]